MFHGKDIKKTSRDAKDKARLDKKFQADKKRIEKKQKDEMKKLLVKPTIFWINAGDEYISSGGIL